MDEHKAPILWMPIAPSGAGKSTVYKQLLEISPATRTFSLDALRHEFYHPTDYKIAYEKAVADKSFEAKANARFHADIKKCQAEGVDLYVDNTNLSARRRRWYIDIARKLGFRVVAVMMPADLDTLLARQKTRGDKQVPEHAVRQQYYALQTPTIGEFDEIVVSDHNLVAHGAR
jgi:predicted kinase